MRGLFKWAAKAKLVKTDPTLGVENPPRKTGDGFIPWTEDDVAAYELRWPIGTRQRVWLDVLLYTGLRRGDAVRFGRQHVKDGVGTIKTEKSGFTITGNSMDCRFAISSAPFSNTRPGGTWMPA